MKSYLFAAYIVEVARITKKILIAWDVEMKKSLLKHDKYYPRFGFKPASKWGIQAPLDAPVL